MNKYFCISKTFLLTIILLVFNNEVYAVRPLTIPALKEWSDGTGEFVFSSDSRIVIDNKYSSQLLEDAKTFKDDIKFLKNIDVQIVSDAQSKPGDIFLTMDTKDTDIGKEGYTLMIGDIIVINAKTVTGVFYGTRTILQLLKNTNNVEAGIARDWPQYRERGLMVDNGRKYFTVEWIENHIKELSYLKMNIFHFHISDNQGFRLECTSHPEITSEQYYTKKEIKLLQELADKYHVILVPEIDMPGHMGAILSKHLSDLALKDSTGGIWGSMIDVTKDEARSFVKDILEEYLDIFTGPYWHLGADESLIDDFGIFPQFMEYSQKHFGTNAEPKDAIFDFINWADSLVVSHGKKMRMWNDYLCLDLKNKSTVKINNDIIVEFWICDWTPKNQTQELLDAGYSLVNCNIDILYYTFSQGWKWQNTPLYETWEPNVFEFNRVVSKDHPGVLGSKLHVWCDDPTLETEGHVTYAIRSALRVLSQKFWGSQKLDSTFIDFEKTIDSIGIAPGVVFPENPMPDNLVFHKKVVASSMEKGTSFKPELAIDGSYDTRWSSDHTDTEWIYVDLEKSYNITRVKLNWSDSYARNYQLQISDDTTNWSTFYTAEYGGPGFIDLTPFQGVKGRYLRIFCSKRASDTLGYSLWEFEVYDSILISTGYDENIQKNKKELLTCYPNPAHTTVVIDYTLDLPNNIRLSIIDLLGNEVTELEKGFKPEGNYRITWNTETYPQGEYVCCLYLGNKRFTKKIILLK